MNLKNLTKTYVGQSSNLKLRMANYLNNSNLLTKANKNSPISKALLKHGQLSFCLIIIEYVKPELLNDREVFWISLLNSYYNVLSGGSFFSTGYKHTDEAREKISQIRKNTIQSEETKKLLSCLNKGENNSFLVRLTNQKVYNPFL